MYKDLLEGALNRTFSSLSSPPLSSSPLPSSSPRSVKMTCRGGLCYEVRESGQEERKDIRLVRREREKEREEEKEKEEEEEEGKKGKNDVDDLTQKMDEWAENVLRSPRSLSLSLSLSLCISLYISNFLPSFVTQPSSLMGRRGTFDCS